jgi:oligoribonuclease
MANMVAMLFPARIPRGEYAAMVLAWIDLEMTGLEPVRHKIVEIATLITDNDLEVIAEGPDLVIHASDDDLAEMDDLVRDMHTHSGLLPQIQASTITVEQAAEETMAFLTEHISKARTVPLCGNSIGTDRRFLAQDMNEIEEFLHYRCVDVSSIKELAKRWNPKALADVPVKKGNHRAMDDIKESVAELRFYREKLFIKPEA